MKILCIILGMVISFVLGIIIGLSHEVGSDNDK